MSHQIPDPPSMRAVKMENDEIIKEKTEALAATIYADMLKQVGYDDQGEAIFAASRARTLAKIFYKGS